jgi:hypothetical protein
MARRPLTTPAAVEALLVEQARALARQLQQAADDAPDGQVLARVETLALSAGREFIRRAAEATLQVQAAAAEKKGRPAGPAPAAANSPPAAGPNAPS